MLTLPLCAAEGNGNERSFHAPVVRLSCASLEEETVPILSKCAESASLKISTPFFFDETFSKSFFLIEKLLEKVSSKEFVF